MKKLSIFAATFATMVSGGVASQERDARPTEAAQNVHHWARGERLPNHYFSNQYAVGDWRLHNLRNPGDGGRWVRDEDGNYVLVSLGTHIIQDIAVAGNRR